MALSTTYAAYYNATFPDKADVLTGSGNYTDGVTTFIPEATVGGVTPVYPAESDVLSTAPAYGDTGVLDKNGTYVPPANTNVRSPVSFGNGDTGLVVVPATTDVRNTVPVDQTTGSLVVPVATDVRNTIPVDGGTGSLVVPAVGDVRDSIAVDGGTGTLAVPSPDDVIDGVATDNTTGKWRKAVANSVLDDHGYGLVASPTTGNWHAAEANEVINSTTFGLGATPGNWHIDELTNANVKLAINYGVSDLQSGSYDPLSAAVFPAEADVIDTVNYGETGGEYTGKWRKATVDNVLDSYSYGLLSAATTGIWHAPEASEVIDLAVFGVNSLTPGLYDTGGGVVPNYPDESEVLSGVSFGPTGAEDRTGNVILPDEDDVLNPVNFGASSLLQGNYHTPANNAVLTTENYGVDNLTSGGWTAALPANVVDTYSYGDLAGTATDGTLNIDTAANLPAADKVLRGSPNYGSGSNIVPNFYDVVIGSVEDGVFYGENNIREGTYDPTPAIVFPPEAAVLTGNAYGLTGSNLNGRWNPASDVNVLSTYSYGETGNLITGRWVSASPGFVLETHDYGVDGISVPGELPVSGTAPSAAEIYAYFTSSGNETAFHTDLTPVTDVTNKLDTMVEQNADLDWRFNSTALELTPVIGGGTVQGEYTWSTNTSASAPGSGVVKSNNATFTSVTAIYISQETNSGWPASDTISTLKNGDRFSVAKNSGTGNWAMFTVTGVPTDNGDWYTIPVTHYDSAGTLSNNNSVTTFFRYMVSTSDAPSVEEIYTHFVTDSREVPFQADLTSLTADVDGINTIVTAILDDTSNTLDLKLNTLINVIPTNFEDLAIEAGTGKVFTDANLSPTDIRDALGMSNADLDVQLDAINGNVTDIIPHGDSNWASVAGSGDAPYRYKAY